MKLMIFFLFCSCLNPFCYSINDNYEYKNWPVLKGTYLGQKPPGMKSEVFAPGIISTKEFYELNSVFSANGKEFYFVISPTTPEEEERGIYRYDLLFTKIENGVWCKPKRLLPAGKYSVADIALSPDGKRLYFCSDMPSIWKNAEGFDIWYVERTGNEWGKPVNAGRNINTTMSETQPAFTNDGTMYFPSNGNIYYSKLIKGAFGVPVKLPGLINTEYGEGNSFISPDESYLLFARWGVPDKIKRGKGLFITFRNKDGSWSKPENTRPLTDIRGSLAALTHDGKYLMYSRSADIYWVDVRVLDRFKK